MRRHNDPHIPQKVIPDARLRPGVAIVSADKPLDLDAPDLFLDNATLLDAKGSSRRKKPHEL